MFLFWKSLYRSTAILPVVCAEIKRSNNGETRLQIDLKCSEGRGELIRIQKVNGFLLERVLPESAGLVLQFRLLLISLFNSSLDHFLSLADELFEFGDSAIRSVSVGISGTP